jgi:hypothetical protein
LNPFSPIAAGFRVVFRRPSIALGEIAWRWSFAATAWVLGGGLILAYLDSLPVSPIQRLLLQTGHPILVSRTLRHILQGSLFRFTEAAIIAATGIAVAWILIASLGRLIVVRSVVDEFELSPSSVPGAFGTLLSLNFLRAAALLAAKVSAIGAVLGASSMWASTHMRIVDAIRITTLLWFVVTVVWLVLNWLLSTAGVFAVADSGTVRESVATVLRTVERSPGPMLATVFCFSILQVLGLAALGGAGLSLLIAIHNAAALLFFEFILLLAYSAISDCLHSAAIAAYVRILHGEEPLVIAAVPPEIGPQTSAVDRDELILGDVPLLA